jgi:2'-5' RNA ligase
MRLFTAIDIADTLRERIAGAVEPMRARLDQPQGDRLAWVKPESWHVTLVFIGEVPDAVAAAVAERIAAPFAIPAFRLVFGGPGLFPPRGRPRVLWVGIEDGTEQLAAVQRAVVARLGGVPFRRENRPFTPHLTLARVRAGSRGVTRGSLEDLRVERLGGCTIDHVTLYRSHLSSKGARYEALVRAPLRSST